MNIDEFMNGYLKARQAIENNADLKESAKKKRLDDLAALKKKEARQYVKDLRKAAVEHALKLHQTQTAFEEKEAEALDNMNFERLNFEAKAIENKIALAETFDDVMQAWEADKQSGDVHKIKAWQSTSGKPIMEFPENKLFDGDARPELLADIQNHKLRISKEPEMAEMERGHFEALQAIQAEARLLGNEFENLQGAVVGRVFDGIHFEENRIRPEFEAETKTLPYGLGEETETPGEVYKRLEEAHETKMGVVNEKFYRDGSGIDAEFDVA
jgi:hypothetical protein